MSFIYWNVMKVIYIISTRDIDNLSFVAFLGLREYLSAYSLQSNKLHRFSPLSSLIQVTKNDL